MGKVETKTGEGERLHARQRKRFWLTMGLLLLIGFVAGIVGSLIEDSETPRSATTAWLMAAGVVLVALIAAVASWKFFRTVDEVEVADNLWGSLVGYYAYLFALPVWWALWKLELVAEPDHWLIYFGSALLAVAIYVYRKLSLR